MNLFYLITGGRPMKMNKHLFVDAIDRKNVYSFEDKFGRMWMANGAWSTFRVRNEENERDI